MIYPDSANLKQDITKGKGIITLKNTLFGHTRRLRHLERRQPIFCQLKRYRTTNTETESLKQSSFQGQRAL